MAHSKVDCRSLTLILSFVLVVSVISVVSGDVKGDTQNKIVYNLSIDGDMDAYIKWSDWSNYVKNGSWWSPGSSIEHHTTINEFVNENGEEFRFLLFNGDMNHKNYGIWEHFSHNGTTITIKNVYNYAVGVTRFKNSHIDIENCRYVVLGESLFFKDSDLDRDGYLDNTDITITNFEELYIYDFTYYKSSGIPPLTIVGNGKSLVNIDIDRGLVNGASFKISPSSMVNTAGVIIQNVEQVEIQSLSSDAVITNHTPDMVLRNIHYVQFINIPGAGSSHMVINNIHYSIKDEKWERGGIGIATENVKKVIGDSGVKQITIENCDTGIAFGNNGSNEGFNNSPYVEIINCNRDYSYGYSYSYERITTGEAETGWQAITGVLVAVAWFRIGMWYMSDKKEKKELAKALMGKAAIGSVIVAIIVYGEPIMAGMVNWLFGG